MTRDVIHVLLIEDNPGDARLIQEMLAETAGQPIELATAGKLTGGVSYLGANRVDVVLLDLSLPDSRGLDALAPIREAAPDTPVVVLTGLDDDNLGRQAVSAGVQDFLVKEHINAHLLVRSLTYAIERQRIEKALRDSEELHRITLSNISDAVFITDDTGAFTFVCWNVRQFFDYSREEVYAMDSIDRLLGGKLFDPHDLRQTGELTNIEWDFVDRSGRQRTLWINVKQVAIQGGTILYTCRDVTARKRDQERIKTLNRVYAVLSNINQAIVRVRDPQALFEEACRIAVQDGSLRLAWLATLDTETMEPVVAAAAGEGVDFLQTLDLSTLEHSLSGTALREGRRVVIDDITSDARLAAWRDESLRRGLRSAAAFPLTVSGTSRGVFVLCASEPGFFTGEELRLLDELALDLSFAMEVSQQEAERKDTEQALHQRMMEIDVLYQASQQLSRSLDLNEIYATVHHVIGQIMDRDTLLISGYDEASRLITCLYAYMDGAQIDAQQLPPVPLAPEGKGMQSEVIRTGQMLYFPDYEGALKKSRTFYHIESGSETLTPGAIPDDDHPRSALMVPLKHQDRVTGVIQVCSYRPNAYSDDQKRILTALTSQAATALSNARLYQQAQDEINERRRAQAAEREQRVLAEALARTAEVLTTSLELPDVFRHILENVGDVVPHDATNIMLIEGDAVRIAHGVGYERYHLEHWIHDVRFPVVDSHYWARRLADAQPLVIPDTQAEPTWQPIPETAWIRSFVSTPIVQDGSVIGFLNLDSETPNLYNWTHVERLQAFTDQAAIAIKNARLYEQIRQHASELEQRVEERTAQLNLAKERIEAILNNSKDAILLCGTDGTIDLINPICEEIFQRPASRILGRAVTALIVPDHRHLMETAFQAVVTNRQAQRLEMRAGYGAHAAFDADVVLSPLVEHNTISGVVCSLRDVTAHKQAEKTLHEALRREIAISELRSRFVSMASHDLRTPLAVIQSGSEMLTHYRDRLSPEQQNAQLSQIRKSIAQMVELLDDILVVGRAEAGKLRFEPERLDLEAFCHDILDEYQVALETGQHIDLSVSGACADILMDPKLLRHIIGNLLSNAIKYSTQGTAITLEVTCTDQVTIRISDQGIGIPAKDQRRLFDTFFRASNVGGVPGTGLGLAIVRQSVELHNGTIAFHSEENVGTTFIVTLSCGRESSN